ncbi:MAG: hypothetical protein HS124_07620 [Anaerolineales bacterium]|nr:hypothetical protein [Anaerolineales bacterium]
MGLPEDLQATSWDGEKYASLRQYGLVPALQDGHVANYAKKNGIVYAPQLTQIGDEEAPVLTPQGPLAPGGTIIEYASPDGKVVRYVRAGIACPDNAVCMQVVSYNPEDLSALYWAQLDRETGELLGYMSAFTDNPSSRGVWLPVGDKWTSSLSGPTALLAGEGYGIDYQQSVDKSTNILFFASGESQYQAKDRDIHYSPRDKRLWIENESGIFLFDQTTHEWTRLADQGTQMLAVGDKQMIIAGEVWLAVSSIDGSSGVQVVTTENGQKWVWGQAGWERYEVKIDVAPFSPEVSAALEKSGLAVNPEDLCLWEGTEGATVQCLTLNPENVPELADNLRRMTNLVSWMKSWDIKNKRPGKYPTLASYEAMITAHPLQLAKDVDVIWHPESADLDLSAALWQKASELTGPDGARVGNEALIDLSQVGLELVDWESVKDEGGWTRMGGGVAVKQIVRPVEGREGIWRIVCRVADIATSKDEARGDKDGDGKNDFGYLLPDSTLTLAQNTASYNQLFNILAELINEVEDDAKDSFMNSGKGIQFFKSGRLPIEIIKKMQDGTKFFGSDN